MAAAASEITHLLRRWSDGDADAFQRLLPLVYERMRRLAHHRLRRDPEGSLNTTALVHEAYLKLVDAPGTTVRDRGHFLAIASRVMRHLLVDRARARNAAKRGGGARPVPLDDALAISDEDAAPVMDLDAALARLEQLDLRQSRILEQRYFGGLTLEEIAVASELSLATVKRELRAARAWLAAELGGAAV
jgi:RNA polymerase sigma factor (TIGR02999 family)